MTRIGDRNFLHTWQIIRAATQPGPEATSWQIGGVFWSRHRYSLAAPDHVLNLEIHRLDDRSVRDSWSLMVVAEHWWDERRNPLRNTLWASHIAGSRLRIGEWMDTQAKTLERSRNLAGNG